MRFWPQDYCNLIGAAIFLVLQYFWCCNIFGAAIFLQLGQVRYRHDTTLALRWHGRPSAEVNENINLGYSQDQGYS